MPPEPNWANRTIFTGDNLEVMRGMNSASVDLIYLDPPFNSNADYSAPIGSDAAGAAFKDTWTLSDVDLAWHGEIAERQPAVYAIIDAAGIAHGPAMKSYLIMMAVRLLEIQRLLKPAGSLYLHCDDAAGHYLKMLLDAILGAARYRNAITWRRATAHNDPGRYGRISDYLLFYAGDERTWNTVRIPLDDDGIAKAYPKRDAKGRRYRSQDLTGPMHGRGGGESAHEWNGYDVASRNRVWSPPRTGTYADYIEARLIPGYKAMTGVHDRLDALDAAGLIVHPTTGFWPGLKRFAAADAGKPLQDIIYEPTGLTNYSGTERVGYPTQKPLALLDLLIRSSSDPGDVVLDPFCGCATTCVAADRLQRQWVGIDLSEVAAKLVLKRIRDDQGPLFDDVTHRIDLPQRTDLGDLPHYRTHKHTLYGRQEGHCSGCRVLFPFRNLTVDHVVPVSGGGSDHITNLQLLCGSCNSTKGTGTHAELIARLHQQGVIA